MGENMEALSRSIGNLFMDGKYSDLEIRCYGRTFMAHRAVVCERSAVLARECDDGFMEGNMRIEVRLFDSDTIYSVLQFIYRGNYDIYDAYCSSPVEPTTDLTTFDSEEADTVLIPFTERDSETDEHCEYQSITAQTPYLEQSFEELRVVDRSQGRGLVTPDAVLQVLALHAYIVAAAEHYHIPALETLGIIRFELASAKLDPLPPAYFIWIAGIVYRLTSESSKLRLQALKLAITHEQALLADDEFSQAIKVDEKLREFALEFLPYLNEWQLAQQRIARETWETEAATTLQELATVRSRLETAERQIAQLKKLNERVECLKCNQRFEYMIEAHGTSELLTRCMYCDMKHFAPF